MQASSYPRLYALRTYCELPSNGSQYLLTTTRDRKSEKEPAIMRGMAAKMRRLPSIVRGIVCALSCLAAALGARAADTGGAPADSAPKSLVGARVTVVMDSGDSLTDVDVLRVGQGRIAGTISSLTVVKEKGGTPKLIGAAKIKQVDLEGEPAFVYDPVLSALVSTSVDRGKLRKAVFDRERAEEKRRRAEQEEAREADADAARKAKASAEEEQSLRLEKENQRREVYRKTGVWLWPDPTDAEQEAALKRQKAFLQEVGQKMPTVRFQLHETKRFLIYTNVPSEYITTTYLPYLNKLYVLLSQAYSLDPESNIWLGKATILAFTNKVSFQQFEATFFAPVRNSLVYGLAHEARDGTVLISCCAEDRESFASVLIHETGHGFAFRYKSRIRLPSWLSEGTAEWVTVRVVAGEMGRRRVEDALTLMRLTQSMGGDFFTAQQISGPQYGIAVSMTDFLLKYEPKPPPGKRPAKGSRAARENNRYRKLIEGIKAGTSWQESLQEAYGLSPEELVQVYGQSIGVPNLQP